MITSQFSPNVSQILSFSREEATRTLSSSVGPEHLLLGILRDRSGVIRDLFAHLHIDAEVVKTQLEDKVKDNAFGTPGNRRELVLNEKASNILRLAVLEARLQHSQTVDVAHLLLAILHDQVNNGAKEILENNNMNYEDTLRLLKAGNTNPVDGIDLPEEEDDDEEFELDE